MTNKKASIDFGKWLLSTGLILDSPPKFRKYHGEEVSTIEKLYQKYIEQKSVQP